MRAYSPLKFTQDTGITGAGDLKSPYLIEKQLIDKQLRN